MKFAKKYFLHQKQFFVKNLDLKLKIGLLLIVHIYLKNYSRKFETQGISLKGALAFFVKKWPFVRKASV